MKASESYKIATKANQKPLNNKVVDNRMTVIQESIHHSALAGFFMTRETTHDLALKELEEIIKLLMANGYRVRLDKANLRLNIHWDIV